MSKKRANTPEAIEKAEPTSALLPSGYSEFLVDLKNRVRSAQLKAAVTVNSEMIQLYWDIGRAIVGRQEAAKWGGKIIVQIGEDLQKEFPGIAGFSRQNIYRMRAFFLAYSSQDEIVSQPARQLAAPRHVLEIPWFHTVTIWEQVKDPGARLWYAQATKEHGWSRAVLVHQIETDLYPCRQGLGLGRRINAIRLPQRFVLANQFVGGFYGRRWENARKPPIHEAFRQVTSNALLLVSMS